MNAMNSKALLARRLHSHGLTGATRFNAPHEAVAWFGAMQAQDYPQSKWAAGARCQSASDASIEQAIADRRIVRTWAVRGTLQLIAAPDVRWITHLVGPRLIAQKAKSDMRRFALDEVAYTEALRALEKILRGAQRTRKEVFAALEAHGISTAGQRGYHILGHAAWRGLICFAPWRGKQDAFVLLDEWLPAAKSLARDEALAELALRYFRSHGPATARDFAWWAGLTAGDARAALDSAKAHLQCERSDGQIVWFHAANVPAEITSPDVHLLAGFDEYLLGYTDRHFQLQSIHNPRVIYSNGIFLPAVVADGQIVGAWSRKMAKGRLTITPVLFSPLSKRAMRALDDAARRYAEFMGMPVERINHDATQ